MTENAAVAFSSADLLGIAAPSFSDYSTDPTRPDYVSDAYREMAPRWQIVNDARESTAAYRRNAAYYLPKFEAESPKDYLARLAMTFGEDQYDTTLNEHTGLVFAEPLKLGKDVPLPLQELAEDIDGEGNHIDVFAFTTLESAFHFGHAAIYTEYPITDDIVWKKDAEQAQIRPYAVLYKAPDIRVVDAAVVGGVLVITRIRFREQADGSDGCYTRYRDVRQEVIYDSKTGRAIGLGEMTWRCWKKMLVTTDGTTTVAFADDGAGVIVGPKRIPVRFVYGGEKIAAAQTKPHLISIGWASVELTQVRSDNASVMHKCNVPTPVFVGRNNDVKKKQIVMGEGIDIPAGGNAFMLEPTGVALEANRSRMNDIRAMMQRQGATRGETTGAQMTAEESRLLNAQRNAKLRRGARSLQDALEGMLADMAAFTNTAKGATVKSGGSVAINQNYSGTPIDTGYLTILRDDVDAGRLALEDYLYVVQNGKLPEDFDPKTAAEKATKAMAERAEREAEAAARFAAQINGAGKPDESKPDDDPETTPDEPPPAD